MYGCILVSNTGNRTYKHFAESIELAIHYCELDFKKMTIAEWYTRHFEIVEIKTIYNKAPVLIATMYVESSGQIRTVFKDVV